MKNVWAVLIAAMLSGCGTTIAAPLATATPSGGTASVVQTAAVTEAIPTMAPSVPAQAPVRQAIVATARPVAKTIQPKAVVTCPGAYNTVMTGERCTQPWADGTVHPIPYGELNPALYGTFVPLARTVTMTRLCYLNAGPGAYSLRPGVAPGVQVPLFGYQVTSAGAKWWWTGIPVGNPPAEDPGPYTVQGWLEDGCTN